MNADDAVERVTSENAELRERLAELEKKAAQFDALCSLTEDVILVLDAQGNHLDAAPTRWLPPHVRAAVIGTNVRDRFPPDLAAEIIQSIQRTLATGEPGMMEYPVKLPDRDLFYHRAAFKPLTPTTVLWMAYDVTIERDLKTAERGLRTFQVLVENAPDGISLVSLEGIFTYANRAYRALTGLGEGLLGASLFDLTDAPREDVAAALDEALARGSWAGRMTLVEKGGRGLPCDVSVVRLPGEAERGRELAVIARDRTQVIEAERQRIELQEQVIEAQRAAIRELSTPLMPLADGVVAMPLIGVIDSARAQEVMERLLDGIVKQRAHTAILDLTGVPVADSHVASAMLQAARAVKLLGARLVLTGIGPAMAQALAQLQSDLSGIVTLGDLQSGITYALRSADRGQDRAWR